jgi:hypothetical protein
VFEVPRLPPPAISRGHESYKRRAPVKQSALIDHLCLPETSAHNLPSFPSCLIDTAGRGTETSSEHSPS